MNSEQSINSFEIKKDRLPDYLLFIAQLFFYLFVNNFSALLVLCKINILDSFDMRDFFQIFIISRTTKILIELNFWLGTHVPYILNRTTYN